MSCRLIAITKPVIAECDTAEDLVAYCARVSNPANQANKLTASNLVKYLINNHHWSPLEMVSLTIEIETTRDIGRQILRHRSFSFQEFSQRYAKALDFSEPREFRLQDKKNRQNSIEVGRTQEAVEWEEDQRELVDQVEALYSYHLGKDLAKEQARAILPEGLTMSRIYMSGTLRSWVHFCQLRMDNGTQKEHAEIARACWAIICGQFPSLTALFEKDEFDLLVDEFGEAMKKKLREQREKGYSGWNDPEDYQDWELDNDLDDHVEKGDPVDIANFAAFKYWRQKHG